MSVRAIQAGRAVILIQATDLTGQTLARISNNMKRFGATMTRVGEQSMRGGLLGGIASGMTLRNFFKFDDLMKELQAKFGFLGTMTLEQASAMKQMEARVRELGKSTSYTSQQVAEAAIVLAQGGLDPTEVKNSLQSILDLGRGTRTELDMAANMYVRAMRAFKLSSADAESTVSQFVRATRYGVLELSDLESGLRYSSGTAATLGQNLAPILAILTELSNVGLAGSIGGTSLNTAMANLVKKMEKIKERFPGFEPATKNGDLDLLKTLERLYSYTSRLSKMERIAVFQDLFNLRGARAMAGAQGIENILGMAKAIEKAGNEARIAADLMDSGPGGSWRKLTSAVDDLSLALGKAANGPIVAIIHGATYLANAFNKVVEANKPLATMLVLSPGIALAAGVGMIVLGKAIGVVGTGFGLATMGLRKFLGVVSAGTARQIAALTATLQNLRSASVSTMGLRSMAGGARAAVGGTARGLAGAGRSQARIATAGLAARRAQANMSYFRMQAATLKYINHNPAMQSRYMYLYRRQRSVRDAALMSQRLAAGARGSALRSILPSMGRGAVTAIKGMKDLTVATARVAWASRRLIPSWFTLLEIFIFFGDKIPGVSNVWNQFAKGFTAAGGALGRIATYMQGPISLLFASFNRLFAGDMENGMGGLMTALKAIGSIIVNQLVSAWNLFKASIAGTWDTLRVVFVAIYQLVTNLIGAISSKFSALGDMSNSVFGKLFTGNGDFGSMIISGAQTLMKGINQLFYWGDVLTAKLGQIFQEVIAAVGALIAKAGNITSVFKRSDESIEAERNMLVNKAFMEYSKTARDREKTLNEQNKEVDRVFKSIADGQTRKDALQNSAIRETWSSNINQFTSNLANQMNRIVRPQTPPQGDGGFQPERTPGLAGMQALNESRSIASSMIGYVTSNYGNKVKFGDKTAKKQLSVLEEIRDNTSDLKDRAETFE